MPKQSLTGWTQWPQSHICTSPYSATCHHQRIKHRKTREIQKADEWVQRCCVGTRKAFWLNNSTTSCQFFLTKNVEINVRIQLQFIQGRNQNNCWGVWGHLPGNKKAFKIQSEKSMKNPITCQHLPHRVLSLPGGREERSWVNFIVLGTLEHDVCSPKISFWEKK